MGDKIGFGRVSSSSADEQSMAQIREILFGEQNRQTATRIGHLETRLGEQESTLRELVERRVDKAVAALRKELETGNSQQQAALDRLEQTLRALLGKTEERITLLDSDLQDHAHGLAQSLERLRQDQVDRAQLAEMFETLARQLRD